MSEAPLPPPKNRANAFFRAFARVVLRLRWPLLAVFAVLMLALAHAAATRLRIDNSTEAFLASGDESAIVLDELRDAFGQDTLFQILAHGDVFSPQYLERLRALHDEVAALDMQLESLGKRVRASGEPAAPSFASPEPEATKPSAPAPADDDFGDFGDFGDAAPGAQGDAWGEEGGGTIVEQTLSLVNARKTRMSAEGMEVSELLEPWPAAADLPALRARVLADRTLVGQLVGKEGRHSVVVVRTQFMNEADSGRVYLKLREIAQRHEAEGFHLEVAGAPALFVSLNARMMEDLALTFGVSNFMLLLIMIVLFRHPIGVLSPLLVCVLAAVSTMGVLALSGRPMTMITNVLPAFLLCVGIGDSIHLQSVYRDARQRGHDNHDAIVYAVGATGVPVLFTSITTAIGLLSFYTAHLQAVRDMGIFGAFGVMSALTNSLVLLPIALSFNKTSLLGARATVHRRDALDAFLDFCNDLSRPRGRSPHARDARRTVLVVGALLGLASLAAASTLTVYHNPIKWFPEGDPTRSAIENLDGNVGGMATISLLIEAPPGGTLKNRETLVAMEKLEQHILAYRDPRYPEGMISNATSLLDVVRESWRAVHDDDPAFYKLPDDERGVVDMLTLFENTGPKELRLLATVDLRKSVMTVRAHWIDAWAYRPLVAHIDEGVKQFFPSGVTVRTTGTVYSTVNIVATLLSDLVKSFGSAFIVITLFMIALLGDVRLGLISMVPNLIPILLVMGFMAVFHVPVDTNTLMVASIAIGIAVDDTIHFLHQFRTHFRAHGDVEAAIDFAYEHTGRAMVSTSVILVTGFISMNIGYMGNVKVFGSLISVTVVFALLFDLVYLAPLLRTAFRDRPAPPAEQPAARGAA